MVPGADSRLVSMCLKVFRKYFLNYFHTPTNTPDPVFTIGSMPAFWLYRSYYKPRMSTRVLFGSRAANQPSFLQNEGVLIQSKVNTNNWAKANFAEDC